MDRVFVDVPGAFALIPFETSTQGTRAVFQSESEGAFGGSLLAACCWSMHQADHADPISRDNLCLHWLLTVVVYMKVREVV